MIRRRPKGSEPTTLVRLPISVVEVLRDGAHGQGKTIASYIVDNLKEGNLNLTATPPREGHTKEVASE